MSDSYVSLKSFPIATSILAAAVGILVCVGWLGDIQLLKSLFPQMPPMSFNSAVSFTLAGVALFILVDNHGDRHFKRRASAALSAAVLLMGAIALSEYALGLDLGIDELFMHDAATDEAFPGRVSPYTAMNFILIGSALLVMNFRSGRYSQWLSLATVLLAFLATIGHAYGIDSLYSTAHSQGMELHTSLTFLLLGVGILLACPDSLIGKAVSSRGTGGFLLRRLLPVAVLLPLILGWLRLKGEQAGLYSTEFGLLIFAASNIIIFVGFIWHYTRWLEKIDSERLRAEDNLRKANRALTTLSKCNMELVRASSERELLDSICTTIADAGGYRMAWVGYALDDAAKTIAPQAHAGFESGYGGVNILSKNDIERGPAGTAIRTGTPVISKNIMRDPFFPWREEAIKLDYDSAISLPLQSKGKTFGALSIYAVEQEAFGENIELLMELADDLSYGIMSLRTQAEHKRSDEESRLLKAIALSMPEAEDMRSAIGIVLNMVCELTNWTFGEAWIPSADGTALECANVWACGAGIENFVSYSKGMSFKPGEGLPGRVWKLQQPEWVNDVIVNGNVYLRTKPAHSVRLRAALGVPIIAGGSVLAVLVFYRTEPGKEDEPAVKVIKAVAAQLGSAMQHKLMEGALKESEQKYRVLVESLPQRIFLKDRNSVYISCNWNYASDLKILPEEIAGKTDYDFYPGHLADKYRADDSHVMQSGTVMDIEENYPKEGQDLLVHTIKAPVRDRTGAIIGVLGLFWDITESKHAEEDRKKLEEQVRHMQKMDAVGQLTSGIAHDFNNMLAAIMISGSIIDKNVQDPKLKHLVQQILSASEKASKLTKGLLAFSRKQVIEIKPVSLNNIIASIEKLLARIIGEEIEVKVELPEDDIAILADAGQVEQVLINLATNARDAMTSGGQMSITAKAITLDDSFAKAHAMGAPGPYALITISDTGIGMDKSTVQKIFEPFFTTKEVGKGTGLGLSIVYGIVKQHNGFINVYSEPGKGTSFMIYLPSIKMKASDADSVLPLPLCRGTETILLAEDNDEVRNLSSAFLSFAGYTVVEAKDGEDALQKLAMNLEAIGLLILDVVMPKKNGKEVYLEALKQKPGIKVIFTSGYDEDVIHGKGVIEEGLNFISKPYVPSDFLKKVREVLDAK